MPNRRRSLAALAILAAVTTLAGLLDLLPDGVRADPWPAPAPGDSRVPLAVLGDSDSQGFQDSLWYPPGTEQRGGAFHAITLQWTEVLARLRPEHIDLGEVGVFGGRRRVVQVMELLGFERRAPRKGDHRNNFAFGGAHCHDLFEGTFRQVPRLLALMRQDAERWGRGVVIVRIGVVDLGGATVLDEMARAPGSPALTERIERCLGHVGRAVHAIRAEHPTTLIVLFGILDNSDYPPNLHRWRDPSALASIRASLDRYDEGLRQLAAADPRVVFFDDRQWFRERWGGRGPDGAPAYRAVTLDERIVVTHAQGDAPTSSVLADGHAGLVWNTLLARSLSELLAEHVAIPPLTDGEVLGLLRELHPPWR
jgi:hypothetical protein